MGKKQFDLAICEKRSQGLKINGMDSKVFNFCEIKSVDSISSKIFIIFLNYVFNNFVNSCLVLVEELISH